MYQLTTSQAFFFRGSGNFEAGSASHTQGIFPPNPQTIYGALRSNYIEQYGTIESFKKGDIKVEIGDPNSDGKLKITGIYLVKDNHLYLPVPQDTQIRKTPDGLKAQLLELTKSDGYQSDGNKYRFFAPVNEKSESAVGKWVSLGDWHDLMEGNVVTILSTSDFIYTESKLGISLDKNTTTTQEGMLYQHDLYYLRHGASLAIDAYLPNPMELISMGNKGTMWLLQDSSELTNQWNEFVSKYQSSDYILSGQAVRLSYNTSALITDSVVQNGKLRFNSEAVYQVVINRLGKVSGWDMDRRRPKARYSTLSPGTSFAIKKPDEANDKWIKHLQSANYSDIDSNAGYGQILLSPIKRSKL